VTLPDYSGIVATVEAMFNRTVPASENENGKAQMTRMIAWEINKVNPDMGLFSNTSGTNVNGLSTDLVVHRISANQRMWRLIPMGRHGDH
jgi:hypothetical protein